MGAYAPNLNFGALMYKYRIIEKTAKFGQIDAESAGIKKNSPSAVLLF